jgi:hypothetical protein
MLASAKHFVNCPSLKLNLAQPTGRIKKFVTASTRVRLLVVHGALW